MVDFERVVVEGPYQVRLIVGSASSAMATGTQQALDDVSVDVQNRTLRIRRNAQGWGGYPGRTTAPAVIVLTTRMLRGASLAGTGTLDVAGARGLRVELALTGAGRLTATGLDADALSVGARGSGTMLLAGRAASVTASVEGSATLDGGGLATQALTLGAATSGEVVMAASRTATVSATGLGRVIVAGGAACTITGPRAGDVSCGRGAH